MRSVYDLSIASRNRWRRAAERAERALTRAGWTYTEGAEEWKPPVGPSASPLLDEITRLRSELEQAKGQVERLATALTNSKEKLKLYRAEHCGIYVGGVEYTVLMKQIDAALSSSPPSTDGR